MPDTSEIQRRIARYRKKQQQAAHQRQAQSEAQKQRARQTKEARQRRAKLSAEAGQAEAQPSRLTSVRAQIAAAVAQRQRQARRRKAERASAAQVAVAGPSPFSALRGKISTPAFRQWISRAVAVIAVISVAANFVQYFRYSPSRPLVTVGHRVVLQREYLADLDGTAGKQVLSNIVYSALIEQAAEKAGVMPTPEEVDARIADLHKQTQQKFPSDDVLYDQVRTQMALENLRMQGTTASEAEIAAFYNQHKAQLAVPGQVNTTIVVTQSAANAARAAHDLSAEQSEAQIASQPGMHVGGVNGFNINLQALPSNMESAIRQAAMTLPIGTSRTFRVGPSLYMILEPHSRNAGSLAPLSQMHDEIARLVRLQKSPPQAQELASLYHANPPSFEMGRYASYFNDIPAAPTSAKTQKTASLPTTAASDGTN
jgi:hypothetical protein